MAYQVFQSETKMAFFDNYFLENLKEVLARLVVRTQRLEILPSEFWVIDKELSKKCEEVPLRDILKIISTKCLMNIPHVYEFRIRAKIFTHLCDQMKDEYNQNAIFQPYANIQVRRDFLVEDSFAATISKNVNPLTQYRIQFVD